MTILSFFKTLKKIQQPVMFANLVKLISYFFACDFRENWKTIHLEHFLYKKLMVCMEPANWDVAYIVNKM